MNLGGILDFGKKNLATVGSILVILICGVVYFLNSGKTTSLSEQYKVLSIQNSNILKNIKFYEGLEEDIVKISEYSDEIDGWLFNSDELAANYNYFFKVEAETGVRLDGLKQLSVSEKDIEGMGLKKAKDFSEIRYVMSVLGEHAKVLNFLRNLEGGNAFYRLESLAVVPRGEGEVELKLSALVLGKKEVES